MGVDMCDEWYSWKDAKCKDRFSFRKSESGGKWNENVFNDTYGILSYSYFASRLRSYKCPIMYHSCGRKLRIVNIFATSDIF